MPDGSQPALGAKRRMLAVVRFAGAGSRAGLVDAESGSNPVWRELEYAGQGRLGIVVLHRSGAVATGSKPSAISFAQIISRSPFNP